MGANFRARGWLCLKKAHKPNCMVASIKKQKAGLRKEIRATLKRISPAARDAASAQLCARLMEQSFWKDAASILFFAPLPDEADVWPLLEKAMAIGKIAALPRFDPANGSYTACRIQNLQNEFVTGKFGIREPGPGCVDIPLTQIDLVLVPGVAFDLRGNRLGRGRGFYDRLLAETRGVRCGIAFEEQIAGAVPAQEHDLKMNLILTPARCVRAAG
jgi:5-formyltetrahydrofolate cyclo-ligase